MFGRASCTLLMLCYSQHEISTRSIRYLSDTPLARPLTRFDGRGHGDSVQAAYERGECRVSPARLKHQAFVLLYSLIEGCHEVR